MGRRLGEQVWGNLLERAPEETEDRSPLLLFQEVRGTQVGLFR